MRIWLLAGLLAGCRCAPREVPIPPPPPSHFGDFEGLVDAAVRGEVASAQFIARSLQEGEVRVVQDDGGATERVGGGLAFVMIAEDAPEVLDGLVAAAQGCGACHVAAGLPAGPELEWTHHQAARHLVQSVVFPPVRVPPDTPEPLSAVQAAWQAAAPEETQGPAAEAAQVVAALQVCVTCHTRDAP